MERVKVSVKGAGSLNIETTMSSRELLSAIGWKLKESGLGVEAVKRGPKKRSAVPSSSDSEVENTDQ